MNLLERKHSWFELIVISLLVFAATSGALPAHIASLISVAHALFLITIFLFIRLLLGRIHWILGRIFFTLSAVVLCAELFVQALSGLHLNRFLLSLLWQPDLSANSGAPVMLLFITTMILIGLFYLLSSRFSTRTYVARARTLGVLFLVSGISVQLLHGLLYFTGKQEVMSVRRSLPLFAAPHPYHIRKLLTPIFGDQGENPFSLPTIERKDIVKQRKHPTFSEKKNVLLIVSDSLRSRDIKADPSLVPNIFRWSQEAALNLNHYSVSNCTHFSMFTLLTGKLPNHFGASREEGYANSLFDTFVANGYATSTSEATALNWYDLSSIVMPSETKRNIAPEGNAIINDEQTTLSTLETIRTAQQTDQPYFHLAYYYGSHFPYSHFEEDDQAVEEMPSLDGYKATLRAFDRQFGLLMDTLSAEGLLDDTIVILTSDHGEEFLDDGFVGHATRLSDDQVVVPMYIFGMGDTSSIQSHYDVRPLLEAELTGQENPTDPDAPVILANCSYEYPDSLSVLTQMGRFDFAYDDGYLTPMTEAPKDKQAQALAILVKALEKH